MPRKKSKYNGYALSKATSRLPLVIQASKPKEVKSDYSFDLTENDTIEITGPYLKVVLPKKDDNH